MIRTLLLILLFSKNIHATQLTLETIFETTWVPETYKDLTWHPLKDTLLFDQSTDEHFILSELDPKTLNQKELIRLDSKNFSARLFSKKGKYLLLSETIPSRGIKRKGPILIIDLEKKHSFIPHIEKIEEASLFEFSSDERLLGYVKKNDLFIYSFETQKETQLTYDGTDNILNGDLDWAYEEEFSILKGWTFSPDSKKIAYLKFDQTNVPLFPIVNESTTLPTIHWMHYPKAGNSNSNVSLNFVDLDTKISTKISEQTSEEGYLPRFQWISSTEISYQTLPRSQKKKTLWMYNLKKALHHRLHEETSPGWVDVHDDLYFFDDKNFVIKDRSSGFYEWKFFNFNGKLKNTISLSNDREVGSLLKVTDRFLYFSGTGNSVSQNQVFKYNLSDHKLEIIPLRPGTHEAEFSFSGQWIIDSYSALNIPPQKTLIHQKEKTKKGLSEKSKQWKQITKAKVEPTAFIAEDGTLLYGHVLFPSNFNPKKKYPVLMYVYGGPGSQTHLDSWGYSRHLWHTFLTQHDIVVLTVDSRGTGNRGRKFEQQTYKDLGNRESLDQIEIAKELQRRSWVDPDRIAIWGWSYGGYLSSLSAARGGNVFNSVLSVAPVTDWQNYDSIYTERFMDTPLRNPKGYQNSALSNWTNGLTANLLLVHGSGDDNVHFQNTSQWIDDLIAHKKSFELGYYPNRRHGIYRGKNTRFHLYAKLTEFLFRNFKIEPSENEQRLFNQTFKEGDFVRFF